MHLNEASVYITLNELGVRGKPLQEVNVGGHTSYLEGDSPYYTNG